MSPISNEPENFFLREFKTGGASLIGLSDSQVRMRDPLAAQQFIHWCDKNGVECSVDPILAKSRRFFDYHSFIKYLGDSFKKGETGALNDDFWKKAFESASEEYERKAVDHYGGVNLIPSSGSVLFLGRSEHFALDIQKAIRAEILGDEKEKDIIFNGRFSFGRGVEDSQIVTDGVTGFPRKMSFPLMHTTAEGAKATKGKFVDYCVIRKLKTAFPSRCFLFIMGGSSLGSLAGMTAITDPSLVHLLAQAGVQEFFETHDYVEVLIRVTVEENSQLPWNSVPPQAIEIVGRPLALPSCEVKELCDFLKADNRTVKKIGGMKYKKKSVNNGLKNIVLSCPESTDFLDLGWDLIGGTRLRQVLKTADRLRLLDQKQGNVSRPNSLLMWGQTGGGKNTIVKSLMRYRKLALLSILAKENRIPDTPKKVELVCNTVPDTLIGSELFGILQGIATEVKNRDGLLANSGIFFLDEVQVLSISNQVMLMKAIDDRVIRKIGASDEQTLNCQIVAAMNESPEVLLQPGPDGMPRMRQDFFYRFRRVIEVPSVAARFADLPAIMASFAGKPVRIAHDVLSLILSYSHPGGIRGLQKIVENSLYRDSSETKDPSDDFCTIELEDLDPAMRAEIKTADPEAGHKNNEFYQFAFDDEGRSKLIWIFDSVVDLLLKLKYPTSSEQVDLHLRAKNLYNFIATVIDEEPDPKMRGKIISLLKLLVNTRFPEEQREEQNIGYALNHIQNSAVNRYEIIEKWQKKNAVESLPVNPFYVFQAAVEDHNNKTSPEDEGTDPRKISWAKKAKEREDFCQECWGKNDGKCEAHDIKGKRCKNLPWISDDDFREIFGRDQSVKPRSNSPKGADDEPKPALKENSGDTVSRPPGQAVGKKKKNF